MTVFFRGEKRVGTGRLRKGDKSLVYEDTRIFSLYSDDPVNTTRAEVLGHPNLPKVGQLYAIGILVTCTSKDCQRLEANPTEWEVTCEFSSEVEENKDGSQEGQQGNPVDWVPIASVGFETYQFYDQVDLDGRAFATSAGEPFSSSIPIVTTLTKWDFEQLEPATLRLKEISARNETVNASTFKTCGKETLKLTVNNAALGFYYGTQCWRISYTLVYKPTGWQLKVADYGSYYLDQGKQTPFKTAPPNQQNTHGFLNPDGTSSGGIRKLKTFRIYEADSFSFLRI